MKNTMIVEVDGQRTEYEGIDSFRHAVRDTNRAMSSGDGIAKHNVQMIDGETGEILSETKKGQRTGMPK